MHEEVGMQIVGRGVVTVLLGTVAVLLGPAPMAMAGERPDGPPRGTTADTQAGPQPETSLLALALTGGGAVAAAGSGVALAITRRRAVGRAQPRGR
jgi:hypothetical protein